MITFTLYFLYIFDMSFSYLYNQTNVSYDQQLLPRVYNGWSANLGDVPYQISFKKRVRKYKYASFCGGAIIAPSKLLSAAHCFVKKTAMCESLCGSTGKVSRKMLYHIYAVAGQLTSVTVYHYRDSHDVGQWRSLKGVKYPPKYSFPTLDFAIVFLVRPFIYNNYVNGIPYASRFVDYDGKCLVSGFGRTSPHTNSDKLLLAHLTLIPWRECNRRHRRKMNLFVCTSSQFTDVGKGDSGGPLVCANTGDPNEKSRGVLVGIVSGHRYGVGTFFTRVSSYYKYVRRNRTSSKHRNIMHLIFVLNLIRLTFFTILILFNFPNLFTVPLPICHKARG